MADPNASKKASGSGQASEQQLHRLDMTSFKKRNSAILRDLEAQEQERDSLWAALQQARLDGERLRQEELALSSKEEDSARDEGAADAELEERAPTSAELMVQSSTAGMRVRTSLSQAMLSPDALKSAAPP